MAIYFITHGPPPPVDSKPPTSLPATTMGRKLDPFYTNNFTRLKDVHNKSKRNMFKCNHCGTELEHRENRLAQHTTDATKCEKAPPAARTAAHTLMLQKATTKRTAGDSSDEDEGAEDEDEQPQKKKQKKQKQAVLDGFVDHPMTKDQAKAANVKLLRYLIHSNSAFLNAENLFLAEFVNELRPSFKISSRTTMSTLLLDAEHSRVHLDAVKTLTSWGRSGTLLIDGWDDELHRSLYGTTAGKVGEPTVVMGLQDLTGHRGSSKSIFEAAKTSASTMGMRG
uniref:C2H2-type domain-containing protein n=1 Tax=Mycena chlorophos TaxID=658473 RepID=A0ABQ0LNZ7_MYCCL|nr:predicted protein [Mycena chlorophos]